VKAAGKVWDRASDLPAVPPASPKSEGVQRKVLESKSPKLFTNNKVLP
jgi:hypothetical protein